MVLDLGGSRPDRPGRRAAPGNAGTGLLYEQVVEYVEKLVSERGLVPGDLLPTYAELAESVGVSLITVRRALDELERAGQVSRQGGSLYDLLGREYGLVDEFEEQYLEVIMPTQEERRLLSIPSRTEVVRIRGLSMDKAGTPFDCFEQLYPAAEFAFAISGTTSRHLLPTPGFQDWDVRSLPPAERDDPVRGRAAGGRAPRPR